MCLSLAVQRPDDVLARGEHAGFEWMVIHNTMGNRCGYVRLPAGHPWHGKEISRLDEVEVHGGISFAEPDLACDGDRADDAWWIGFDCCHAGDAPDPTLPLDPDYKAAREAVERFRPMPSMPRFPEVIRTQDYVEAECRSLCERAAMAGKAGVP